MLMPQLRADSDEEKKRQEEIRQAEAQKLSEQREAARLASIEQAKGNQTANNPYIPISDKARAANAELDKTAAARYGKEQYEKNKWQGDGLIFAPAAALMNMFTKKKKISEATESEFGRLTQARAAQKEQRMREHAMKGQTALTKSIDAINSSSTLAGERVSLQEDQQGATAGLQEDQQEHAILMQQDRQDEAAKQKTYQQVHNPDDISKPMGVWQDREGQTWVDEGKGPELYKGTVPPKDFRKWVDDARGGSSAAAKKFEHDKLLTDVNIDPFVNTMREVFGAGKEILNAATGRFDPQRHIGEQQFAGEDSKFYNEVNKIQSGIKRLNFVAAGPLLRDVQEAFGAVGGLNNSVPAMISTYKNAVIPKIIGEARAVGVRSKEEIDAIEKILYEIVDDAEKDYQGEPETDKASMEAELKQLQEEINRDSATNNYDTRTD